MSLDISFKLHSILDLYSVSWSEKLGCGISGPVRPCTSKKTGKKYALKCLLDKPRSRQELNLQMRCAPHPHIVKVKDIFANEVQFPKEPEPRSRLLVVMELMEGGELFERISKQKNFTEGQAAKYTHQISKAIERCHSLNVAHRDIKPENILLKDDSENSEVKLSDFGFAKIDDGTLMTPHFTPYYVAPQVLKSQQHIAYNKTQAMKSRPYTYDKSCDMWSLGVLVYIMLTGYPPFYSETPSKSISRGMKQNIMEGNYEFIDKDWVNISDAGKDFVSCLLQVDPERRMDINQVMAHRWLTAKCDIPLMSPSVLIDRVSLSETNQIYSEVLTNMRMPDRTVRLKPIAEIKNRIRSERITKTCSSK